MLRVLRCNSLGSYTKGLQRLMLRVLRCDSLGSYRTGLQRLMLKGLTIEDDLSKTRVDHKPPIRGMRENGADHKSPIGAQVDCEG
eukprot:4857703-Amphidinium_carterae.1